MFIAIIRRILFSIIRTSPIVFIPILVFSVSLYAGTPTAPAEPEEPQINIPSFEETGKPDTNIKSGVRTMFASLPTQIIIAERETFSGFFDMVSNISITITNTNNGKLEIASFSFTQIDKIEVKRWGFQKIKNNQYFFFPVEYRIYAPKLYIYNGNLPFLNEITVRAGNETRKFYTVFYDYWIKGEKGHFRWQNSRASDFAYNFRNPISGTTRALEFKPVYENIIRETSDE
jgi:hypothetical protein